jgi:putative DNA primase/helicase
MINVDLYDVERSFLEAMNGAGITPPNEGIRADGQIHRYHIDGDSHGSANGSYQLWTEGLNHDGRPNGWFMDYKRGGEKEKWQFYSRDNPPPKEKPTEAERNAARARREADERAEAGRRREASERAREIWCSAKTVESGGHS